MPSGGIFTIFILRSDLESDIQKRVYHASEKYVILECGISLNNALDSRQGMSMSSWIKGRVLEKTPPSPTGYGQPPIILILPSWEGIFITDSVRTYCLIKFHAWSFLERFRNTTSMVAPECLYSSSNANRHATIIQVTNYYILDNKTTNIGHYRLRTLC